MKPQKIINGLWLVEHETDGLVFLDTKSQTYTCIESIDYFNYNGKKARYFNTISEFISSNAQKCVVPLTCVGYEKKKNRIFMTFSGFNNSMYSFFDIEDTGRSWVKNNIILPRENKYKPKVSALINGTSYFVILEKMPNTINECIILKGMKIQQALD